MDIIRRDPANKSCPKGYRKLDANGLCIKRDREKEGLFELPAAFKKCPKGFKRKPNTRQCRKTKKKRLQRSSTTKTVKLHNIIQLAPDSKRCPEGYSRVKGTRQCKKRHVNTSKTVRKKLPNDVPMLLETKRCPKGTGRIPDTALCHPSPPKLSVLLSQHTSPSNIILRTRSPSINKLLGTKKTPLLSFCPAKIGDYETPSSKRPNKILVKTKSGTAEWVGWSTKAAKDYMMQQFLSNVPIDCGKVRGPQQYFSNCWFNTFFMSLFISDKGRNTFQYLRNAMITGEFPATTTKHRSEIPKPYKKGLFYLNALIQNSLHGALPKLYDTNNVVKSLNIGSSKVKGKSIFPKLKEYSNPLVFYIKLIESLEGPRASNRIKLATINVNKQAIKNLHSSFQLQSTDTSSWHQQLYERCNQNVLDFIPDFICVELDELVGIPKEYETAAGWWMVEGKKKWGFHGYGSKSGDSNRFKIKAKDGKTYIYELDSLVARDTTKQHFGSFLTCNKKDYVFDGACNTKISPLNWKRIAIRQEPLNLLQRDSTGLMFDLLRNYNVSFYYRVE